MPEVIDEEEEKQGQKERTSSSRAPVEGPGDGPELTGRVDEELAEISAPVEPPDQRSDPFEPYDDPEVGSGTRPLYKRPAVLVVAAIFLVFCALIGFRFWLLAA